MIITHHAVRSYRTISPLPLHLKELFHQLCKKPYPKNFLYGFLKYIYLRTLLSGRAVYFLLHFPSAFTAQKLSGTLLCGARTFLKSMIQIEPQTCDRLADSAGV